MDCKGNWLQNFLTKDLFSDLEPAAAWTHLYAISPDFLVHNVQIKTLKTRVSKKEIVCLEIV
jgi:hypothetical protein